MDSIAPVFSFSHQPTPVVPVFKPAPGTVQNTEAMYQFACTLRGNTGTPESDTPAQAVAIFKEAAARGHTGAMHELVVIYTDQSDHQEQASYYKDRALASLTETGAQRILDRKEGGSGSPDDAGQTDRTTNPLTELYEKCAAYLHNHKATGSLPNELWHILLGQHLSQVDRGNLAATCRTLSSVVRSSARSFVRLDLSALSGNSEARFCEYLQNLSGTNLKIQIVGRAGEGEFGKWFKLFCSQVGGNKKLNALQLTVSGCRLTRTEASCLAVLTSLTSLDISTNQLGDPGAQALAVLAGLTSLNISANKLGEPGAQALAVLTGLTSLNISWNQLGDPGAQALAVLTGLTSLDISSNQLRAAGAQALGVLTGLTSLNISANKLGEPGAQALAVLTGLTSLNISANQLRAAGAQALAVLTGLTSLDISWNQLGDRGAQALAVLTGLTSLNIRANQLGDPGAQALAALTGLTSLDIGDNRLGAAGEQALAVLTSLTLKL